MTDYVALNSELTIDPLTRGYSSMSDAEAAADLNTVYRPVAGGIAGMMQYCATHKNRTNTGGDLTGSSLMGRLHHVAGAAVGSDPFDQQGSYTLELAEKHAAQAFVSLLESPQLATLDYLDTEIEVFYDNCTDAGIWKVADVTALKGLSQNQITRGSELGFGKVREADVTVARAI